MRALLVLAIAIVGVAAPGCIGSIDFRRHAFVPEMRHYRVRYVPGAERERRLFPDDWVVRSHVLDAEGRPGSMRRTDPWEMRSAVDLDGDGNAEHRGERPLVDLEAERGHEAAIWARTVPVARRHSERSLASLAHAIGRGQLSALVTRRRERRGVEEPTELATSIVAEREIVVAGVEGRWLDLALRGPHGIAGSHLSIVVFAPDSLRWREAGVATREVGDPPMLVVLGLETTREPSARDLETFRSLLTRLDVRPE